MQHLIDEENQRATIAVILTIGALWGIFEATVGYLLHLFSIGIGWLIWYPAACFFMALTYLRTKKAWAVVCVGVLSASVKLINLFFPLRIDRVINPSVSIVFEALAVFCVLIVFMRVSQNIRKKPHTKALAVVCMNTGWRVLYMLYLLLLVPQWMRDISVISSTDQFLRFFLLENAATSTVVFLASLILHPVKKMLLGLSLCIKIPARFPSYLHEGNAKLVAASLLLCTSIALQILL